MSESESGMDTVSIAYMKLEFNPSFKGLGLARQFKAKR